MSLAILIIRSTELP